MLKCRFLQCIIACSPYSYSIIEFNHTISKSCLWPRSWCSVWQCKRNAQKFLALLSQFAREINTCSVYDFCPCKHVASTLQWHCDMSAIVNYTNEHLLITDFTLPISGHTDVLWYVFVGVKSIKAVETTPDLLTAINLT